MQTGKQIYILKGHTMWVLSVAISEDCQFIVSGGDDCTVKLWNLQTGEEL
jgi:WD40 repeat protein